MLVKQEIQCNNNCLLQRHEPDAEMRSMCKLTIEGFARYLMDKDNYAFVSEHARQTDEVTINYIYNLHLLY